MPRNSNWTSVITGDIINSRGTKSSEWLRLLKKILVREGPTPKVWEIYRGDSFQLEVKNPTDALIVAYKIKASIKSIKNLDVRMSIGIGSKDFNANKVTESNGQAFVFSGEKLEGLKKEKQNLAIRTPWTEFDKEMNLYIRLALIAMDNWTTGAAILIKDLLEQPDITQSQLANKLKIAQSSVSERKKRAYYSEIMEVEQLYQDKIKALIP